MKHFFLHPDHFLQHYCGQLEELQLPPHSLVDSSNEVSCTSLRNEVNCGNLMNWMILEGCVNGESLMNLKTVYAV